MKYKIQDIIDEMIKNKFEQVSGTMMQINELDY